MILGFKRLQREENNASSHLSLNKKKTFCLFVYT